MNNIITLEQTQLTNAQLLDFNLYESFFQFIDVKEKSIATYKRALKQFFIYMRENNISNPQREDVLNFREALKQDHKATTVQAYIVAVRLFFQWTSQIGKYPNIAEHIKGAKINREHKKDYLTANQVVKVLNKIDTTTLQGKRDYAIVMLMVTCGLRTIEVSRADIEDVSTRGGNTVLYIQGKGRDEKAEYVKLDSEVEDAIRDYLSERGQASLKSPLFASTSHNSEGNRLSTRSVSGIVKECLKKAGFNSPRLSAHSLRHTTATINLLNKGTLEETQQLLRHTNINTTMVYLHHLQRETNNSEYRIAGAIKKARKG